MTQKEPPTHGFSHFPASRCFAALAFCGLTLSVPAQAPADTAAPATPAESPQQLAAVVPANGLTSADPGFSSSAAEELPSAPQPQAAGQSAPSSGRLSASTPPATPGDHPTAPLHSKYIPAGYRALPLTAHDKVVVGFGDLYSFENFGAIFLSAGYEHLLNSEPNYGTDKGAFGERLGAAALRETTQGIFSDMVFAPAFHQDPRYYQKGPEYNPVKRTLYAIARPLVTRTDSGHTTVNASLLVGYAAAAALTPAYYPQSNRNFHDTLSTYGGSIGGAALGFFVDEFSSDVLIALHLKHHP